MAMRWDAILTAGVAAELNQVLSGARLKGVYLDHGAATLHVYFREATVLVDLSSSEPGVQLLDSSEPPEGSRTFPCTLAAVDPLPDERVLVLLLKRFRGKGGDIRIVVEFVPRRSNATVVEGDHWTVRHVLVPRSGARAPRAGSPYPKPHSERRGVDAPLDLEDWLGILEPEDGPAVLEPEDEAATPEPEDGATTPEPEYGAAAQEPADGAAAQEPADAEQEPADPAKEKQGRLLSSAAFTSPINAPALLDASTEPDDPGPRGHALWLQLREIGLGAVSPASGDGAYVLECEWGDQPYPAALPGYRHRAAESLLAAIREVQDAGGSAAVLTPSRWTKALADTLRTVRRKHGKLERELGATPDPGALRLQGDLILSHLQLVHKGATEVTLPGFEGSPQTIALDPSLSPQDNAERYYDRAGRAERARARLPGLISEAESRVTELADLLERSQAGDASADEIREVLPDPGLGGSVTSDPGAPALPYKRFWTSGGLEVRVGRGSKANDRLTFKHSSPNDVWLHARHAAGAHVVLRWTGGESPPARDLEQAAILAALHSKARSSGSVPVDWTRRKYVRKPRKAPPGSVQLDRAKTLFVEPDPALLDRLKER